MTQDAAVTEDAVIPDSDRVSGVPSLPSGPGVPDETAVALAAAWCGHPLDQGELAADPPGLTTHPDRDGRLLVLPSAATAPLPEGDHPPFVPAGMREHKALVALLRAGWDGVTSLRDMPWVAIGDILAAHGARTSAAARHPKGGLATLARLRLVEVDEDSNGSVRRARAGVALWATRDGDDLAMRRLAEAAGVGGQGDRADVEGTGDTP